MTKQIGTKEKKEIRLLVKNGVSQATIAKKYSEDGYVTKTGKPFMNYSVSAIVNEKRAKVRAKKYWQKNKSKKKTARKTNDDDIPDDFLLEIVASKALSKVQKVKQLIALLDE